MAGNWSAWICGDRDLECGMFSIKGERKEMRILNMIKHNDQELRKLLLSIHIVREVGVGNFVLPCHDTKRRL